MARRTVGMSILNAWGEKQTAYMHVILELPRNADKKKKDSGSSEKSDPVYPDFTLFASADLDEDQRQAGKMIKHMSGFF